jgi:hypothetical protein
MEMFIDFARRRQFWVAFILIVFLFFIIFKPQTRADLVYFYPQTCLGSFVNPEKAQGEREVDNPDLINESNSAVYYSGFKEIYCGNFQGPIKEGEIKKVTLHFNWVITKELREKPVIELTSSESLIEKIIPPKTIEINIGTSDVQILENTSTEIQNNTNTQTATSSQIFKFINFVFAQDETRNELQRISETNGNESNNINTNSNEINNTNGNESQTATSSYENINQSEESVLSQNSSASKTLFDIHYTLDGQKWNYLGSVNENNWQNLAFDIPVAEVSLRYGASPQSEDRTRPEVSSALLRGWLDISKIQIKINSYPDTDYYLYLESMWLEVEYENASKEISETTTSTEQTILQEPLKARKFEKIINIKNPDNLSCSADQFSINIKEGETKFVNFKLKGEGIKNLEIGSLPAGIDIVFSENNDYQISTNSDIVQLKIYRQKGSEKGNFSLPIIFSSKDSTIICQINVITN